MQDFIHYYCEFRNLGGALAYKPKYKLKIAVIEKQPEHIKPAEIVV